MSFISIAKEEKQKEKNGRMKFKYIFVLYKKILNFVPMIQDQIRPEVTCDNLILVDADFADHVAFDLIVNFERMLARRIPNADMARWIDCLALDGGIREGKEQTQVALIHSKGKVQMDYFTPGHFGKELDGQAFKDNLGEFVINAFREESMASRGNLMTDMLRLSLATKEVKRIVMVPDEEYIDEIRQTLRHADSDKQVTILAMHPIVGGNFRQEILGYSLMSALGIKGEELG